MGSDYMWISIFQTSSYFWSQGGLVSAGYQTWYHANFGWSVTCDNRARHNWEQGQPGQAHAVCWTIGRPLPRKANLQGWIPPEIRGSPQKCFTKVQTGVEKDLKMPSCQVVALQSSIYQNNWVVGEVFHHSKDILHPVAELKIIYLEINFSSHMINLLKISYVSLVILNIGNKITCTYIASKFWRATSTLMIIEHTGMVVYWAVSEQKVKVFLLQCCCLLLHLIKQWALCPSMCVYSCSPGTLVEVVLIERMTLLNESKESKGQRISLCWS